MEVRKDYPYLFDSTVCSTCGGRCCRGAAGYVWVSLAEVEAMAAAKNMAVAVFARHYVRRAQGRLSLQERVINNDNICCFFDPAAGQCTIYESRPRQCRTFPFWDKYKTETQALFLECPGVSAKDATE